MLREIQKRYTDVEERIIIIKILKKADIITAEYKVSISILVLY